MSDENSVTLIGNLGISPELRFTQTGTPVCNFTLATNELGRSAPEWHRIVVWGKSAETCAQYLAKGRKVHIRGRLQTRRWESKKDGSVHYTTEIVAQRVNFLDRGPAVQQQASQGVDFSTAPEVNAELSDEAQAVFCGE